MIESKYSKDLENAYQILTTSINADKAKVFQYLATTDGISSWFPELSIINEHGEQLVTFDMGNGLFQNMTVLEKKENEHFTYEWATGKVEFELIAHGEGTQLIFKEELPLAFDNILQDFAGWHIQIENIKNKIEQGDTNAIDKEKIREIKSKINDTLFS